MNANKNAVAVKLEMRLELALRQDRPMFDLGIASVRSEPVFGSSVRQTVELQTGRRMVVISARRQSTDL
jgi:hypothetical protein